MSTIEQLLPKIGFDTAENQPSKACHKDQHFARKTTRSALGRRQTKFLFCNEDTVVAQAYRPSPQESVRWVEKKESSPNTDTGNQPNIKSCPNIDSPRISNLSGI